MRHHIIEHAPVIEHAPIVATAPPDPLVTGVVVFLVIVFGCWGIYALCRDYTPAELAEKEAARKAREGVVTPSVTYLSRYVAWLHGGGLETLSPDEQDAAFAKIDAGADALSSNEERIAWNRWMTKAMATKKHQDPAGFGRLVSALRGYEAGKVMARNNPPRSGNA